MKVGLFFGSFNPIHNGHLIIANQMYERVNFDEVWLIPSPQNPFKEQKDLLPFENRLEMIKKVIKNHAHLKVNSIENKLSLPSFTIHTLEKLQKKYGEINFHIIMGTDILTDFHHWKDHEKILQLTELHIYNRNINADKTIFKSSRIHHYQLPLLDISSTSIRKSIQDRKSVIGEIDSIVWKLIEKNQWYF
ncbi:MAG: nicotinate (nicotinamide) nucleotide adenylyltransferase [Chitinophagales bacterium]|nr:nicotinate (nicotinamide) nucleotide adenylyltransferase [Chitinophagales bacterium]